MGIKSVQAFRLHSAFIDYREGYRTKSYMAGELVEAEVYHRYLLANAEAWRTPPHKDEAQAQRVEVQAEAFRREWIVPAELEKAAKKDPSGT